MKKLILSLLIICSALFCATAASKNKIKTVEGCITSYGSMPFNFPGLVTDTDEKYGIVADSEVKKELLENQGKKIRIKGYLHNDEDKKYIESLEDGFIEVENWEIIK
jgi:hypothetical protein